MGRGDGVDVQTGGMSRRGLPRTVVTGFGDLRSAAPVTRYTPSSLVNVYAGLVRTNIVIDDELLAEAQRLCGASTKRATVEFALQELVRRRERRKVLDL